MPRSSQRLSTPLTTFSSVHRDNSLWTLVTGWMESATRISSTLASDRPRYDTLPVATRSAIAPQVGDEFNPGHHEAMLQQPAEGVEPGHVSLVMTTGYKLGDRVVRPAKVGVAPAAPSSTENA